MLILSRTNKLAFAATFFLGNLDTILMDYEMPLIKGPDAVRKIREIGYTGFILGVTGNVLAEDVDYFIGHGANGVLPKPVSLAKIKAAWKNQREDVDSSARGSFAGL